MFRTHHCNELRKSHVGKTVTMVGWVNSNRDHAGVIFTDLRDREGVTQIVFKSEEHPEVAELSHKLRQEDVIQIVGVVSERPEFNGQTTVNPNIDTGEVEVVVRELRVLNKADVLPFQLDKELSNEDLRMKYRYLDLRRPRLRENLRLRHRVTKAVRDHLDKNGFVEVETPVLSKSTPEGARDFLVPSRLSPGKFYALPQAPQQYKQLLMVAGVERYFQIARCFRDEDLRADRQPEFTQVDIEASFITQEDIFVLIEGILAQAFAKGIEVKIPKKFPRMTYQEAMDRFGVDRPDTRYGLEIIDLTEVFVGSKFGVFQRAAEGGGVVRAINAKGFAGITTGQVKRLEEVAKEAGAGGLAYIKVEGGEWKSPIVKFFGEAERTALQTRLGIEEGDLILFGCDKWDVVCNVLGRLRTEVCGMQGILEGNTALNFLWVTDFPLLAYDAEEGKWAAVHHPFTRPKAEDVALLEDESNYGKVRADAYDVVLNGVEIGGGSIRIHEQGLQAKLFTILGISEEEQQANFSHILTAFRFGAPPHGGIALGLDRLVMLIAGESSIREVIAFPKNNKGTDLMSDSPAEVDFKQLRELYVKSTFQEKKKD
ncbi:MAG: aspartyl-tRNA synthetase [Verrucomicrobia bacterium]|nr:MAG: aspartyl-tRNA synthetase [Verrucomicrobiota bacterium]